jgi:hypothetical protein
MRQSSVAPLQGARHGGHPIPGLKPGVKHGQAPTAQSLWRGLTIRNPRGRDMGQTRTIVRIYQEDLHNALRCKRLTMLNPRLLAWGRENHPKTVPCKGTTILRCQLLFFRFIVFCVSTIG